MLQLVITFDYFMSQDYFTDQSFLEKAIFLLFIFYYEPALNYEATENVYHYVQQNQKHIYHSSLIEKNMPTMTTENDFISSILVLKSHLFIPNKQ